MTDSKEFPSEPQTGMEPGTTAPLKPTSSGFGGLGAAALTVLFYALLVDAAVETFLSGSPVRLLVAATVAAYLVLTVCLWRFGSLRSRFGWSARTSASFFVLLGLLAWTVWLPGGLTNGVAMLRQPTSIVLSAVSALAVAVAGLVLVRVRFLPWWGRAALGLLALYGVAAFAVGVMEAVPYPNLFQGGSLWRRLPYWLQGAFIGTLIAVPLAMVAAMVDAFKRLRAADGHGWGLQQSLALGLATLMAVSGFTISAGPALGVAARDVGSRQLSAVEITEPLDDTYAELSRVLVGQKESQPPSPQEILRQLEQLFPVLEAAAKTIPRDTFDISAVVEKVGREPVKLFEWVRDETYLVPYRGLLRGHTGVLMDRLGNSLDRAVLLHAMLGSIGQTVRLATGELTNEQAETLLEKVRPVPPDGIPALAGSSSDPTEAVLRTYAQEQHLDHAALRQAIDKLAVEQQRVREAVQNRVTQQTAMIAEAIGKPSRNEAEESATRIQAVKEHWWVEWQNGSTWTALDPSLPDAAPAVALTNAARTFSPGHFRDLGADRLHWIQLRVVVETWNRGQVSEAAVLTRDLLPAELIGKSIVLRFVPVAWPRDLNLFQEKDPRAKLKEVVLTQGEWLPILQIDGQNIARYSFNDYGDFNDATLPVLVQKTEEAVQGLGKSLGGLLGGSKEKKEPAEAPSRRHATAVWIDYEIHSPGQAARTVRRDILDLLGPASRAINPTPAPTMTEFEKLERGLALMGETDILPLVSQLSSGFVEHLAAKNLLANREVLFGLLGNVDSKDPKFVSDQASKLSSVPLHLYSLALGRREWSRFRGGVYLDRPNILSYHKRLRPNAKGEVLLHEGFDIVTNDVTARQALGVDPFLARVEQGVLDTNVEALVAAASCQRPADGARCGEIYNTAEFFGGEEQQRTAWETIRNLKDEAWQGVEVSRDVRERIEQDLAGGYAVIVPRKPVGTQDQATTTWWRVDPRSGATLGIGETGGGQSVTEWHFIQGAIAATITWGVCGLSMSTATAVGGRGSGHAWCAVVGATAGLTLFGSGVLFLSQVIARVLAFGVGGFFAGRTGPPSRR